MGKKVTPEDLDKEQLCELARDVVKDNFDLRKQIEQLQAESFDLSAKYNNIEQCYQNERTLKLQLQAEIDSLKKENIFLNRRVRKDDRMALKIKELEAELDKLRWIPVSERLPKAGKQVLYCDMETGYSYVGYMGKPNEWWYFACTSETVKAEKNITHWRPITLPNGDK